MYINDNDAQKRGVLHFEVQSKVACHINHGFFQSYSHKKESFAVIFNQIRLASHSELRTLNVAFLRHVFFPFGEPKTILVVQNDWH
jgi:hypothetical protein